MNELLTQAMKEAYASHSSAQDGYDTLEIRHPSQPLPIYIVRSNIPLTANLEDGALVTFAPVGFNIRLPDSTGSGSQSLDITIDNVGNLVGNFIDQTKLLRAPVEITYRPYLSSDLSTPQMVPPLTLYLKSIKVRPEVVNARASFVDVTNRTFPNEDYNRQRFPSLGG